MLEKCWKNVRKDTGHEMAKPGHEKCPPSKT